MKHIAIISASVREGRLSHRVALFIQKYIEENSLATVEILDLKAYDFPLFSERLMFPKNPSEKVLEFADRVNKADGVIIVSPVYNASFPAALKNVMDLFVKEWRDKIVAVASVTAGTNAGITTILELQALLVKLGALVVPTSYTAMRTETEYDEQGNTTEEIARKQMDLFIRKLLRLIEQMQKGG
jgi:NAD(P)H-dependent FMN reductase